MTPFTIETFFVCKLTGGVQTEYKFQFADSVKVFQKYFVSADNAARFLESEARAWFLDSLEKFVNHKKHIIQSGNHQAQSKALNVCETALQHYEKKEIKKVCELFLKGITYFEAILPSQNNNSFKSSSLHLQALKTFCTNYLKTDL